MGPNVGKSGAEERGKGAGRRSFREEVRIRFRRMFSIDPRSLGLFRIAFGLTLILDLIQQASILSEMTTDAGSLPRALHHQLYPSLERWSLHLMSGAWGFQAFLYALTFAAVGALIVGYRTRWATVAIWILLTSLHNRHPMFGTASDSVRRLMLFWGFFLPLGCRFSLDRRAGRDTTPDGPIVSVASGAILLQVLYVYLGAGLGKDYETWVRKGTAVSLALHLDYFATHLGKAMLQFPGFLKLASVYTWWLENVGPLLLLSPIHNSRVRLVAIPAFMSLHAALFLFMVIGAFPLLMIACWLLFLPPLFWSWLEKLPRRSGFVGRWASGFESLVQRAADQLPLAHPGPAVSQERPLRSWIDSTPAQAVVSVAMAMVLTWNLQTFGNRLFSNFPRLLVNESIIEGMRVMKLTQNWEVFSPHPSTRDGWLMVVATLRDGSVVDLFRDGRPVDWTKPEHVADVYQHTRWTKYSDNLRIKTGRKHRRPYVEMHVRRWNAHEPESRHVKSVQLIHMIEMTLPDMTEGPLTKDVLWEGTFD